MISFTGVLHCTKWNTYSEFCSSVKAKLMNRNSYSILSYSISSNSLFSQWLLFSVPNMSFVFLLVFLLLLFFMFACVACVCVCVCV
jgi:hypothetical protein